mmetsp:Transcript_62617/g.147267  ORF Transcript_62617/g.147267 Transcript_62617/m.147267 type:complete len:220 (-) Transcript_62617:1446-2105(-)
MSAIRSASTDPRSSPPSSAAASRAPPSLGWWAAVVWLAAQRASVGAATPAASCAACSDVGRTAGLSIASNPPRTSCRGAWVLRAASPACPTRRCAGRSGERRLQREGLLRTGIMMGFKRGEGMPSSWRTTLASSKSSWSEESRKLRADCVCCLWASCAWQRALRRRVYWKLSVMSVTAGSPRCLPSIITEITSSLLGTVNAPDRLNGSLLKPSESPTLP